MAAASFSIFCKECGEVIAETADGNVAQVTKDTLTCVECLEGGASTSEEMDDEEEEDEENESESEEEEQD